MRASRALQGRCPLGCRQGQRREVPSKESGHAPTAPLRAAMISGRWVYSRDIGHAIAFRVPHNVFGSAGFPNVPRRLFSQGAGVR